MPESEKHGGDIWSFSRSSGFRITDVVDLSSNANDFFSPEINFADAPTSIRYYPEVDLSEYREKISRLCQTGMENVAITAGLTDFVYKYMSRYTGKIVIVLTPSYGEFRKAGQVSGVRTVYLPSELVYRNPEVLNNYRFSSLIISRPEPPTGNFTDLDKVETILKIADRAGASTLIDEAFIDFVNGYDRGEALKLIGEHPSLYLGRSLTKILPFPGLRLGYVLASRKSIDDIETGGKPWGVGQFDLSVLRAIDFSFVKNLPAIVKKERDYLIMRMKGLGYGVVGDPAANFVTFTAPEGVKCDDLQRFVGKRGIMIRCVGSFMSFEDSCFRIAIKRREFTDRFLQVMRLFENEG
ncbi:MAG: hypothetical protein B2I17_03010 [Thermoplasmatales archaeon B_DKE]|nr:MAG: hypothetical protein B2I17_03010 [Thermoplasmatales archaeon B_DKE]QRF75692.1 histidinol-phosphate aminotransferase [Thermoplasmatales archaeon]